MWCHGFGKGGTVTLEGLMGTPSVSDKVSMLCWNVAGWAKGGGCGLERTVQENNLRSKVLHHYQPDIVCLVDMRLKGDEIAAFDGYQWFGHNRFNLSNKAVGGSGSVGLLVRSPWCQFWTVTVVEVGMEDVMWVRFEHKESCQVFLVAVCYFPPVGSSRDVDIEECFQILSEQIQTFQLEGQVVVCGDFNARCGGFKDTGDLHERIEEKVVVDHVVNDQGELLVECLLSSGLCMVNGCKGNDKFTCIIEFAIKTMSECERILCSHEEGYRAPDHSILVWDLLISSCLTGSQGRPDRKCSWPCTSTRFTVPEGYMSQDSEFIQSIIAGLLDVSWEQSKLDAVYTKLIEGMKRRLKVVKHTAKKGQPWFTKELLGLRKVMHQYESSWLRS